MTDDELLEVRKLIRSELAPMQKTLSGAVTGMLSLAFFGVSTWIFHQGKLSENIWFSITVMCMAPVLGQGVKVVAEKIFSPSAAARAGNGAALLAMAFGITGVLGGCQHVDREIQAGYDGREASALARWTYPGTGRTTIALEGRKAVDWWKLNSDLPPAWKDK